VLDEPTTGLDPNQIIEIRSLIRELGRSKTVILSTHILQEVEAVCSRVLILNEGRIAAQGAPAEIGAAMKGGDTWEILVKAGAGGSVAVIEKSLAALGLEKPQVVQEEGGLAKITLFAPDAGEASAGEKLFDWAVSGGHKILEMSRKRLSLEDIFVKLTREQLTGEKS